MTIEIATSAEAPRLAPRSLPEAMRRGASQRCPACGKGAIYRSFLKVADSCPSCGEELHHHRADDAPPYFTIFIVGHIVVAAVMYVEKAFAPELWVHALLWIPLISVLSLLLLPRIKGVLIGLQWALRMHGFGGHDSDQPHDQPTAAARR
jgi:uncharacterized protein (DUF983 family)